MDWIDTFNTARSHEGEPDLETILMVQINAALNRGAKVQDFAQVGRFCALTMAGEYMPINLVELGRDLRKQKVI